MTRLVFNLLYFNDLLYYSNGIVILFAASLKNGSTGRKYGLVLVPNDSDSVPYSCDQFIDLSLTEVNLTCVDHY